MSFRWGNSSKVLIFIRMITIFGSELEWLISNIISQISVITPAKREHLLVGTCLLENIISRKHKKDIDEDRKKFRHQWVDISLSEQERFNNLKHKIFSDFTPSKINLLTSELAEKYYWGSHGITYIYIIYITHVMLKLLCWNKYIVSYKIFIFINKDKLGVNWGRLTRRI